MTLAFGPVHERRGCTQDAAHTSMVMQEFMTTLACLDSELGIGAISSQVVRSSFST